MGDLVEQVKQMSTEFTVEPGFVADVNLANAVYDIKTEVGQPTLLMIRMWKKP